MSFPYLDLAGFRSRLLVPGEDVDLFESRNPGFIVQRIASQQSYINARLRKRYGNSVGVGNSLPLGQQPPLLEASGTNPPAVGLIGRPVLGSLEMVLQITTGGPLGTALFKWSSDGGRTFTASSSCAALVLLGSTGMAATFPVGTYGIDNTYSAATPVPEAVIGWLVALVTDDFYSRRGRNPQDPAIVDIIAARDRAIAEIREAADSKDGLFDLPVSDDEDSAVTTGGPMGYSEQSPYTWVGLERDAASREDSRSS